MKGFPQVFSFTFQRIAGGSKWKGWTIAIALLLFLIPAVLLPLAERGREEGSAPDSENPGAPADNTDYMSLITDVYYVTETKDGYAWDSLTKVYGGIGHHHCSSLEEARSAADAQGEGACVLVIRQTEQGYQLFALTRKDASKAETEMAYAMTEAYAASLPQLLAQEMPLSEAQMDAVYTPVLVESSSAEDDDGFSMIRDIAGMALPYVNIMLIYFMVLLYSNTVANHVILEKTSKLMDTFLVSVKPRAMVFGKVLAVWVSSLLQLLLWAGGLAGGCALGAKLARSIHPQSTMGILRFFDYLKQVTGFFSPVRILLALLLIAAGFLLYCAMAGVSGSFASKPEELSAAMQINQLILVISFLLVLRVCIGNGSGTPDMIMWYDFVPYTAILVTPARLLMGQIPVWAGLVSVLLTGGLAVLASYFAGKVYSLMSLYKGNALNIKEMFKVILR